jgi:hypothetical protein
MSLTVWVGSLCQSAAGRVAWVGFCGLLSLCYGPEISWEICVVAYAPV